MSCKYKEGGLILKIGKDSDQYDLIKNIFLMFLMLINKIIAWEIPALVSAIVILSLLTVYLYQVRDYHIVRWSRDTEFKAIRL